MSHLSISAARADALFASALQPSAEPSVMQILQAIAEAIGQYGGCGCSARVAQAYGDYPDTAATRMRWARIAVTATFGGSRPTTGARREDSPVPGALHLPCRVSHGRRHADRESRYPAAPGTRR